MAKKNVEKAAKAIKETQSDARLEQSELEKEVVAQEAQKLRVQLGAKTLQCEQAEGALVTIKESHFEKTGQITALEEEVGDLRLQINSATEKKTAASRPEAGKYAARIFGSIVHAHQTPASAINPRTADEAVRGALLLCAALDRKFPVEKSDG